MSGFHAGDVKDRATTLRSYARFLDVQPVETELVDHLAVMRRRVVKRNYLDDVG